MHGNFRGLVTYDHDVMLLFIVQGRDVLGRIEELHARFPNGFQRLGG